MEDRFTYGLNPEKLGAVSSYLCDPNTAPAEFLLVKSQYLAETGRAVFSAGPCSFRSGSVSARGRLQRKKQTVLVMKRRCAGQRESISSSSVRIPTRPISTITFISMRRPLTAPGNFIISLVRPLPCGGSLTACASNMNCLLSKIRASTARAVFSTMDSGSEKSHPLPSSGCGWLFSPLWRKAHGLCRLSSSHGGVRLCGETWAGRCHLIPCTRAGKTDPAPGFYTWSWI